jgi:hypothetical protein
MMTRRAEARTVGRYEIRVTGHLDERWATWFAGLTLTHEVDGTTALRGPVIDQAELHGHLARVRDLGATLVSVTALEEPRTARTGHPNPTEQE